MTAMRESRSENITKTVHVCPIWLPPTQTWMYNQARFLPPDVEVHIVCEQTSNLDQFALPNIRCHADEPVLRQFVDRAARKLGLRRTLAFLNRQILEIDATIVHSHFGPSAWRNISAIEGTRARHVVSFYGADATQVPQADPEMRPKYRELFGHVDAVLCEGPAMVDSLRSLGCPAEKTRVHHLGVDLERLPYRPRVWMPGEPLRVLMSATFREKKGLSYGILALGKSRIGSTSNLR